MLDRLAAHATTAAHLALPAADNPLDGVSPNLNVFGPALNAKWKLLVAGIWGAVLAVIAVAFLLSLGKWAYSKKITHNVEALTEGAGAMKQSLLAFGAAALAAPILGAVLWVAS